MVLKVIDCADLHITRSLALAWSVSCMLDPVHTYIPWSSSVTSVIVSLPISSLEFGGRGAPCLSQASVYVTCLGEIDDKI